ncbi:hypothetical protein Lfu02_76470 [Longispora fulva]|uniref:Uncharacterized protein n=1 Tax=Longispora fulva TaxID=619741 RepID=A0A8J7GKC1_9ACTN|nr:hypothetical protein [Longispora fulva]MBG6138427.1 hypothetical protein [Longispora fulva]GIG63275.1 hypothetical protein Lfu02_76470 [Longispora fulva]
MIDDRIPPSNRRWTLAAVVAGLGGVSLVVAGWSLRGWQIAPDRDKLGDADWWLGIVSHGLAHLAFGKVGFKVALAAVGLTIGLVMWLRQRRKS